MTAPLLSIWIPSYNRAALLRDTLASLGSELASLSGAVEVVISDNASADDTRAIGEWAAREFGMRYFRNDTNIGIALNFKKAVSECRGEYVWGLGDDDLVHKNGVAKVVSILRADPSLDFVFVNSRSRPMSERKAIGAGVTSETFGDGPPFVARRRESFRTDDWQTLLAPEIGIDLFVGFYTGVIRRSRWEVGIAGVDFSSPFCSTLPSIYPHCVVYGRSLIGRPAYYLADPLTVSFNAHQDWRGYNVVISLVWVFALLDMYQENGADPDLIDRCRRDLLRKSGRPFLSWIRREKMDGRELFRPGRYLARHWKYPELWTGLTIDPVLRRLRRG